MLTLIDLQLGWSAVVYICVPLKMAPTPQNATRCDVTTWLVNDKDDVKLDKKNILTTTKYNEKCYINEIWETDESSFLSLPRYSLRL